MPMHRNLLTLHHGARHLFSANIGGVVSLLNQTTQVLSMLMATVWLTLMTNVQTHLLVLQLMLRAAK